MLRPHYKRGPGHIFTIHPSQTLGCIGCMFLHLPHDAICSVARFRICAHTQIETVTWTHKLSSTCNLRNANDVLGLAEGLNPLSPNLMTHKMSSTPFFTAPIHTRSLSTVLMCVCFIPQVSTVSAFLSQNNNKHYSFLHASLQLSSVAVILPLHARELPSNIFRFSVMLFTKTSGFQTLPFF